MNYFSMIKEAVPSISESDMEDALDMIKHEVPVYEVVEYFKMDLWEMLFSAPRAVNDYFTMKSEFQLKASQQREKKIREAMQKERAERNRRRLIRYEYPGMPECHS